MIAIKLAFKNLNCGHARILNALHADHSVLKDHAILRLSLDALGS